MSFILQGTGDHHLRITYKYLFLFSYYFCDCPTGIYVSPLNKLAPSKYHGLGVRIEDDVLITLSGPVVLTVGCPKQIDEIENLMSKAHSVDL